MATEVEKFMELESKLKELETKTIRIEEQFKARKQDLADLVREIKDAGYDPNALKQTIAEKEEEVKVKLIEFEKQLEEASQQLSKIEA